MLKHKPMSILKNGKNACNMRYKLTIKHRAIQTLTRTGLYKQAHTGPTTYFRIHMKQVPYERNT